MPLAKSFRFCFNQFSIQSILATFGPLSHFVVSSLTKLMYCSVLFAKSNVACNVAIFTFATSLLYNQWTKLRKYRNVIEPFHCCIYSGHRPALQGGRPMLAGGPRYPIPNPAVSYEEERGCTDYCCLACDSEYKWYNLRGKGENDLS